MPHSQALSNNPYPELNQLNSSLATNAYFLRSILIFSSYIRLDLPEGLFPVGVPVKIFKALLLSSIQSRRYYTVVLFR